MIDAIIMTVVVVFSGVFAIGSLLASDIVKRSDYKRGDV